MHPQFLSNTYLVADGDGGPAFFVDAGGPVSPLIDAADRLGLTPTHVLLTHHHFDHVSDVRAPGHSTYADLRDSIMGTLMELPPETVIYPGHSEPTTVAREWQDNGFIRVWRGLDPEGAEPCTALGEPATLVLLGQDYDGGT